MGHKAANQSICRASVTHVVGGPHLVLADIALTLVLWGVVFAEHAEGCHKQGPTQNNSCPIQSNSCAFVSVQILCNSIALRWHCLHAQMAAGCCLQVRWDTSKQVQLCLA